MISDLVISGLRPLDDSLLLGLIVSKFLSGSVSPQQYCQALLEEGKEYNGFSTIVTDLRYIAKVGSVHLF